MCVFTIGWEWRCSLGRGVTEGFGRKFTIGFLLFGPQMIVETIMDDRGDNHGRSWTIMDDGENNLTRSYFGARDLVPNGLARALLQRSIKQKESNTPSQGSADFLS